MTPTPITSTEDTRPDEIVSPMSGAASSVYRSRGKGVLGIVSRSQSLARLASIVGEGPFSNDRHNNSVADRVQAQQQSMVAERLQCAGPRRRGRALGQESSRAPGRKA